MSYIQNTEKLFTLLKSMLEGTGTTLSLFSVTLVCALPLGFLISLASISRYKAIKKITNLYILIMRGTPLLLQVIFIFFGLPLIGIVIPRFTCAVIAFVLNYAAYFSEIFRGGIQSIERGQFEAADVLGLTHAQTMRKIVLPQVVKRVMPSIGNEVINLVKDTALIYAIGIRDLLKVAQSAVLRDFSVIPLLVAGVFYLVMISFLTWLLKWIESKLAYYR